jgi:hypothetical protein
LGMTACLEAEEGEQREESAPITDVQQSEYDYALTDLADFIESVDSGTGIIHQTLHTRAVMAEVGTNGPLNHDFHVFAHDITFDVYYDPATGYAEQHSWGQIADGYPGSGVDIPAGYTTASIEVDTRSQDFTGFSFDQHCSGTNANNTCTETRGPANGGVISLEIQRQAGAVQRESTFVGETMQGATFITGSGAFFVYSADATGAIWGEDVATSSAAQKTSAIGHGDVKTKLKTKAKWMPVP